MYRLTNSWLWRSFLIVILLLTWMYANGQLLPQISERTSLEKNGFHYEGETWVNASEFAYLADEYGIGTENIYGVSILDQQDNRIYMAYSFNSLERFPNLDIQGKIPSYRGLLITGYILISLLCFTFIIAIVVKPRHKPRHKQPLPQEES